jgi:hypothetical protein
LSRLVEGRCRLVAEGDCILHEKSTRNSMRTRQ